MNIKNKKLAHILDDHTTWLKQTSFGAGPSLQYVTCINEDFSGHDMPYMDMAAGNFANSNFTNANLIYISGIDATFVNANLNNACLNYADLTMARLMNADLRQASLKGACFYYAHLEGAKFGINICDASTISYASFSEDALEWLILRNDWPKEKDTIIIIKEKNI